MNFSGVLCIDEAHEGPRHILFATDPLLDATIAWDVVKKCDQEAMNGFPDRIRAMGFSPGVVITDGSALRRWREHPLHAAGRARPGRLKRRHPPARTSQRRAA